MYSMKMPNAVLLLCTQNSSEMCSFCDPFTFHSTGGRTTSVKKNIWSAIQSAYETTIDYFAIEAMFKNISEFEDHFSQYNWAKIWLRPNFQFSSECPFNGNLAIIEYFAASSRLIPIQYPRYINSLGETRQKMQMYTTKVTSFVP